MAIDKGKKQIILERINIIKKFIIRGYPLEMQNDESLTSSEYAIKKKKDKIAKILTTKCCNIFDVGIRKLDQRNIHLRLYFIYFIICTYKLSIEILTKQGVLQINNYFLNAINVDQFLIQFFYYSIIFLIDIICLGCFLTFKCCITKLSYLSKDNNISRKNYLEVNLL